MTVYRLEACAVTDPDYRDGDKARTGPQTYYWTSQGLYQIEMVLRLDDRSSIRELFGD
jgi:hypothetical protein